MSAGPSAQAGPALESRPASRWDLPVDHPIRADLYHRTNPVSHLSGIPAPGQLHRDFPAGTDRACSSGVTAALFSVRSLFVSTDHMPAAALTARARELWECLAGAAAGFTPAMSVAVVPRSYLCPPGWAGIVVLGSAALATAPDHDTARFIEQALSGQPAASLTDTEVLSSRLPAAEILGPASLAYLDPAEFRPSRVTPSPRLWAWITRASGSSCWQPAPMTSRKAASARSPHRPSRSASTARSSRLRATGTGPAAQHT